VTNAHELGPGAQIGGYTIEALAGRGGMGLVYRARQERLDRLVAIKVIAPEFAADEAFRIRFEREAMIAARIEHPNVLPVYEVGEVDGRLFLVMRYVQGADLGAVRRRAGRLEPEHTVHLTAQVAAALDAAHACGLVHRDVKPGNVLLSGETGREHAYLTDFGLAKRFAESNAVTGTGRMVGTLDYIAPEQARGERVDARTDVYALGCMLYELLTGSVPFPREQEVAKIYAHVSEPPPRVRDQVPTTPTELDDAVARAMAKAPEDRFASAGDLGRAAALGARRQLFEGAGRSVAVGAAAPPPPPAPDTDVTRVSRARTAPVDPPRPRTPPGPSAPRRPAPPTRAQPTRPAEPPSPVAPVQAATARHEAPPPAPGARRGRRTGILAGAAVVVLIAAGAAVAVATSGGHSSHHRVVLVTHTDAAAASTGSTSTSPPAAPAAPTAIVSLGTFLSPSRNIGCIIVAGTAARCDIAQRDWSPPARPSVCPPEVDYGQGLVVANATAAQFVCAGDTARIPGSPALPYGEDTRTGGFQCASRLTGMTCTSLSTGHGFFISRQSYRIF
jgi:serine/threonine protein kinase